MKLVAYYYLHKLNQESAIAHITGLLGRGREGSVRFFSAWGPLLRPTVDFKPCAHYLTPLDQSFGEAVILAHAIPLPASKQFATIVGQMLLNMGPDSVVWIQQPTIFQKAAEIAQNLLMSRGKNNGIEWPGAHFFQKYLPCLRVSEKSCGESTWLRLEYGRGLDSEVRSFGSSYPALSKNLEGFFSKLARAGLPCADPVNDHRNSAENAFTYSMHWALHTAAVLEKCTAYHNAAGKPSKVLDLGGSYGFLGCELASGANRDVTVVELAAWQVKEILPWLSAQCGISDQVQGVAGRMQDYNAAEASIDLVLMMGSLLYLPRADVNVFLRKAMNFIKPGGCLVVRENLLLEESRMPAGNPEMRFTPSELHSALSECSSRVEYYDHMGRKTAYESYLKLWTVFAVVWKD